MVLHVCRAESKIYCHFKANTVLYNLNKSEHEVTFDPYACHLSIPCFANHCPCAFRG